MCTLEDVTETDCGYSDTDVNNAVNESKSNAAVENHFCEPWV